MNGFKKKTEEKFEKIFLCANIPTCLFLVLSENELCATLNGQQHSPSLSVIFQPLKTGLTRQLLWTFIRERKRAFRSAANQKQAGES